MISAACMKLSASNSPSDERKRIKFNEAKLQALSFRNRYSAQGFEASMRPEAGQVCQSLIVVSNCIPGSPHKCVASAMLWSKSFALCFPNISPVVMDFVSHVLPSSAAFMNSSVARTLLFAF
ncbi:hypothetical protein U14_01372 [Candidatus Moduliflexus flocculans]|uniref:Uncharacterized protein n=1 Tax=Candidatus Moduliflexus flocculans TaxID=1499966 RepID=A0A0S6VXC7_9BACT|nr:hypothetical protein U14_01372 [Candidatus Moduliflexus flocculans]